MTEKLHIERNTVQETLIIPLYGRKLCNEQYPDLFRDEECEHLISRIDYDFDELQRKAKGIMYRFGALEVCARYYDLQCEINEYLKAHPRASVVNMGCGLDTTFRRIGSKTCRGYELDFPDVIDVRRKLLPDTENDLSIPCDLNDTSWFERISFSEEDGAVFYAAGVFYYFTEEQVRTLFSAMAERFPGAVVVFDAAGRTAVKMMLKTWIRTADIKDVGAYFSVDDPQSLMCWSENFGSVSSRGYMQGYRKYGRRISSLFRLMCMIADGPLRMAIIRIGFKERNNAQQI